MLEKPATGVEREHEQSIVMMDGNEAVAAVAHLLNEVIAIYPITPASPTPSRWPR